MLRFEVCEAGRDPLPAVDLDDPVIVIGSGPAARIRLPAAAARAEHVRIEGGRWRTAEGAGSIGDGADFAIGAYRVHVAPAPAGSLAAPVQRTESLARELIRSLLGAGGAPALEVERGPLVGARRTLAPPESTLVIGRGDDAGWIVQDGDLSKRHAEIRRGWDGVRVVDLGSKNGTLVDGVRIGEAGAALRDGALLELGNLVLRYRDPAEKHLGGPPVDPAPGSAPAPAGSRAVFYAALALVALALAGLAWLI